MFSQSCTHSSWNSKLPVAGTGSSHKEQSILSMCSLVIIIPHTTQGNNDSHSIYTTLCVLTQTRGFFKVHMKEYTDVCIDVNILWFCYLLEVLEPGFCRHHELSVNCLLQSSWSSELLLRFLTSYSIRSAQTQGTSTSNQHRVVVRAVPKHGYTPLEME